jgi:UPF0042 nucleotide-binding protein
MEMLLVTGLSGSGKSQAVNVIEDMGYYCIDNIPAALIPTFIDICSKSGENKVAVVTDARSGDFFSQLAEELRAMRERGVQVKILFLDCDDATLVRRYKETRRRHPLLDIADGDPVEIFSEGDRIVMVKYQPNCLFCGSAAELKEFKGKQICASCIASLTEK